MNFIDEIRGKGNFEAKKSLIIMRDYNFNCSYPKKSFFNKNVLDKHNMVDKYIHVRSSQKKHRVINLTHPLFSCRSHTTSVHNH